MTISLSQTVKPDTSKDVYSNRFVQKLMNAHLSKAAVMFFIIASLVSGIATYAVMTKRPEETETVFWLININLGLFLVLAIFVARQITRLWIERKKGLAGSQLHVRLVFIFSLLTAAPAILMTLFSAAFFYFGVQAWFSDRVSTAVSDSLVVAEAYLEEHHQTMRADALAMANDINREVAVLTDNPQALNRFVQAQSLLRNLSEVMVFTSSGRVLARSKLTFTLEFDPIPQATLEKSRQGDVVLLVGGDVDESQDRVRALIKLDEYVDTYLLVGRLVDEKVIRHLNTAKDAVEGYAELEGRRSSFQLSITFMFLAVALLLLFVAVWFGLVFAGQLVRPISQLILASERVRSGDFTACVDYADKNDELGVLGLSFNRMTSQLADQREELIEANRQIDERRRFTEAVLASTSSGIVGLDGQHGITLANPVAARLFDIDLDALIGKPISEVLPEIEDLFSRLLDTNKACEVEYITKNDVKRILSIRVTKEVSDGQDSFVLTFDDVSPLVAAQRKAAWSDVARRIAHEIKNPLTPIQLSAERLHKKYLPQIEDDPESFQRCTETIVRQVEQIGHMVKEFSDFARIPDAVKAHHDVIQICRDAVDLQKQAYPDIQFSFKAQKENIVGCCDAGQIAQVLNNILLNAIQAIQESKTGQHIDVSLNVDKGNIVIDVKDDGPGLPKKNKQNLTEPYVTTRKKGTGLGLAIVKKILDDHNGSIDLDDRRSAPSGAHVTIRFEK